MPQVYRRHSDYSPRPSLVPRRRSSMAPTGPGPQPTDADDSIVLADLVRTGEASRLRRRGAMRLDHGPGGGVPRPSNAGPSSYAPPARPIVIQPSRTPSPELPADTGADEYTYTSMPSWRDWQPNVEMQRSQTQGGEGVQAVEILNESTQAGQAYVLHCGGEDMTIVEQEEPPRRFEPSLFPDFPPIAAPSTSSRTQGKSVRRSNGCGALVHVRAYPQRPRGVWMAKEDAAETVVGLDPAYCDHPAMDKMLKSACGCVREGIGCSVCGNTLGTRYVPCQAASESIFTPSTSSTISPSPPRLHRPSGPSYWNARPTPSHRRSSSSTSSARGSAPSYYTFFADRVSASPAHDQPSQRVASPTFVEPRRGESRPASPEIDYGYRWTASPQPVATPLPMMNGSSTATSGASPPSPVFAVPPLPPVNRSQLRPASVTLRSESRGLDFRPSLVLTTPSREVALGLDPDGVPLAPEPGSPDKESMPWPSR